MTVHVQPRREPERKRQALGRGLDALIPSPPTTNGWQSGPPPGRFDDDAPTPVAPSEYERAPNTPPSPWESLIAPALTDWYETPPPARSWLLRDLRRPKADGLLPLGKVGQLIAEGGAGKTMCGMQLAVSVSTAVPWLGSFSPATTGRVLFLLGEEDQEEARRRSYRARRVMDAPIPKADTIVTLPLAGVPCAMLERDDRGNVVDAPFLQWLRTWLEAHGPFALIIVDPLSRFAGPDAEVDNAAATRFVQGLESIASLTGATVLVAHHTNKLARRGGAIEAVAGRGSSALVDGVRWQCSLGVERVEMEDPDVRERLGEIVTWSHTKSNYSRRADDLLLRRDLDNGGALVPLDDADRETVQTARSGVAGRSAKTAQREAERAQAHSERKQRDAELRTARQSEKEEATRRRDTDDDEAARKIDAANPGAAVRKLVAILKEARACGTTRALDAIHRVRETP